MQRKFGGIAPGVGTGGPDHELDLLGSDRIGPVPQGVILCSVEGAIKNRWVLKDHADKQGGDVYFLCEFGEGDNVDEFRRHATGESVVTVVGEGLGLGPGPTICVEVHQMKSTQGDSMGPAMVKEIAAKATGVFWMARDIKKHYQEIVDKATVTTRPVAAGAAGDGDDPHVEEARNRLKHDWESETFEKCADELVKIGKEHLLRGQARVNALIRRVSGYETATIYYRHILWTTHKLSETTQRELEKARVTVVISEEIFELWRRPFQMLLRQYNVRRFGWTEETDSSKILSFDC